MNNKKIIYIVEDSKIISGILKKVISSIPDVETKEFTCGEVMFNNIGVDEQDMVFLDYYLYDQERKITGEGSNMNGEVIFNKLQEMDSTIPVVLLTGMSDQQKINELKSKGFSCVIHKDDDDIYDSVIECVNKFLPK